MAPRGHAAGRFGEENAVFEARHHACVMLDAARTSGHDIIILDIEDVASLIEVP